LTRCAHCHSLIASLEWCSCGLLEGNRAGALDACCKHKVKLVIAKLDRLSRNLAFIAKLMDAGVEFIAVDNPHANELTLHILAAVAEQLTLLRSRRECFGFRSPGPLSA
jgi:hypothetical protein